MRFFNLAFFVLFVYSLSFSFESVVSNGEGVKNYCDEQDYYNFFVNPALISLNIGDNLFFSYAMKDDLALSSYVFSYVSRSFKSDFGAAFVVSYDDSVRTAVFSLPISYKLDNHFTIGVSPLLKYYKISTNSYRKLNMNISLLYTLKKRFFIAAGIQNFIKSDSFEKKWFLTVKNNSIFPLFLSYSLSGKEEEGVVSHAFGIEYRIYPKIFLRTGYYYDVIKKDNSLFTVGVSYFVNNDFSFIGAYQFNDSEQKYSFGIKLEKIGDIFE